MRELLRQLVAQTSLAIARYVPVGHGMCDDNDHDRLVVAIANGNIRESQDIMRAHLTACECRLMLGVPEELNNLQAVFAEVAVAE